MVGAPPYSTGFRRDRYGRDVTVALRLTGEYPRIIRP